MCLLPGGNCHITLKKYSHAYSCTARRERPGRVIAALQEKDEEDHGEESAFITLARCHKNSEKIEK
jgi:hypothetical protein